jgi:Bacterial Ig domain
MRRYHRVTMKFTLHGSAPLVALTLLLALGGCGGGLFIGTTDDDQPPTVSLVAGSSSAAPRDVVRLAAAAVDDNGIGQVQFYRREDDGGNTLLGTDGTAPYELDFTVPSGTSTDLRFFARAIDDNDQDTDSALVTVTLK